MIDNDSKIVRFKMRVIDSDRSEPTLARIAMNSIRDSAPKTDGGKYVAGEPQNTIRFQIADAAVANLFVQGQDYYIDFEPTFQEVGSNEDIDNEADNVETRTKNWDKQNNL
jgi:hypothetical protein